jgi:hypothetical protein
MDNLTMVRQTPASDEWVDGLDSNVYGVRLLTLRKARELATAGSSAGWYISPFALKWTVGRMARDGRRYHVVDDGEPVRFETMAEAAEFLSGILRLATAPNVTLSLSHLGPVTASLARLPGAA